jgi:hypothetical protein
MVFEWLECGFWLTRTEWFPGTLSTTSEEITRILESVWLRETTGERAAWQNQQKWFLKRSRGLDKLHLETLFVMARTV